MLRIPLATMQDVVSSAFIKAGMNAEDARLCARIHCESSCDGVYSHGLNRVPRFVDFLQRGWVDAQAKPVCVKKLGALEIYDGQRGPGILNAFYALNRAMELAAEQGVAIVSLRNTTHWMRGGTYGWHAADKGYASICWTNTESVMPAWGGKNPSIGNNPLVMAVPRAKGHLVLDMAMSQYSYGKLQVTRLKGEQLPYPGGFDHAGNLTSEPGPIEESMRILPAGYWKGSGLAILLDTLAAVLSEGLPSNAIDQVKAGSCTGCSQVFILIDPSQMGGAALSNQIADSVAASINQTTPDNPQRPVTWPGESTARIRQDHLQNGVIVDPGVWAEVLTLADITPEQAQK